MRIIGGKSLIVYFSIEGANYVNGSIVNLPIGNTEVAAKIIQKITGSDMKKTLERLNYKIESYEQTVVENREPSPSLP